LPEGGDTGSIVLKTGFVEKTFETRKKNSERFISALAKGLELPHSAVSGVWVDKDRV
jgi:hypothetical protein